MLRWYVKPDGTKMLQESCGGGKVGPYEWRDVPTEVEAPACDHAWDGLIYASMPPQSRCRKCLQFYLVNVAPKLESCNPIQEGFDKAYDSHAAKPEPRKPCPHLHGELVPRPREWWVGFSLATGDGRPIVYRGINEPKSYAHDEYRWIKVREVIDDE